jgi:beta-galactosidase
MDGGWKFKLADAELLRPYEMWLNSGGFRQGVPARSFDDGAWREVNLPHDFVVEGDFVSEDRSQGTPETQILVLHGSHPSGVAWYRRRFSLPQSDAGRRIYLYFDGIFRDSRIYLNQYYVGSHASGYSSFYFDVTDLVEYGGENLLVVRADATRPEGWFYEGGGIYRHVWLVKTSPLHIGPWGTTITSEVDFSGASPQATLQIKTCLENKPSGPAACLLAATLLDPQGRVAGEAISEVVVPESGLIEVQQMIKLDAPQLWSVEHPALYQVVSTIILDNEPVDALTTSIGIRSVRFDAVRGFLLNEQPVKLKGVCCHQDHAGVGSALPDRLHEYRIEKLKEMGCNAYRCSHNPPAPEILDACDRLGMLVMDEKRRMSSAEEDLADLESIIRRDRNHPSIVLWSIGNEEVFIHWTPQSGRIARTLVDWVHRLDPTRPVTLAISYWNPATGREEPIEHSPYPASELDVMGFNYAVDHWEEYHAWRPNQPMVISEASSNLRTRGCYQSDVARSLLSWDDPHSQNRAEEQWAKVAKYPYLSGTFIWTGFDYRGEPHPHGWPAVSSHFGLMDTCGFPKDSYYYFKAGWTEQPLVHLFPHWNWPEKAGQPVTVGCYSNCEEVELFLNGQSLGRQAMQPNSHLEWKDVVYAPGALEARGYRGGAEAASARVETTGPAFALRLKPDRDHIIADGRDVCVVNVEIVDAQGRVVPTASDEISFIVEGPGQIIGVGNGNPGSHEAEKANHRRAFNGLCQAILQAGQAAGMMTLTAKADGLLPAGVTIVVG